jgi:hypothetical protein
MVRLGLAILHVVAEFTIVPLSLGLRLGDI